MFKKIKDKRAIGTTITIIAATIVVGLILIIFFIATQAIKIRPSAKQAKILYDKIPSLEVLETYLQSSVTVMIDGKEQEITFSDLILLYGLDRSYEPILKEETEKIFGIYGNCYQFRIPYYMRYKDYKNPYYDPDIKESGNLIVGNTGLVFKNYAEVIVPVLGARIIKTRLLLDSECSKKLK